MTLPEIANPVSALLAVRSVNVHCYYSMANAYKVTSFLKAILAGDTLPAVPMYKRGNVDYCLLHELDWPEFGDDKGGSSRSMAHFIADKPMPITLVDDEELVGNFPSILLPNVELDHHSYFDHLLKKPGSQYRPVTEGEVWETQGLLEKAVAQFKAQPGVVRDRMFDF